jgi:hypothetical protein
MAFVQEVNYNKYCTFKQVIIFIHCGIKMFHESVPFPFQPHNSPLHSYITPYMHLLYAPIASRPCQGQDHASQDVASQICFHPYSLDLKISTQSIHLYV